MEHAHLSDDVSAREEFPTTITTHVMTPDEQWAYDETEKIVKYGDGLGEPVHMLVAELIKNTLLQVRRSSDPMFRKAAASLRDDLGAFLRRTETTDEYIERMDPPRSRPIPARSKPREAGPGVLTDKVSER